MSIWVTEQDLRESQNELCALPGLTLNVAFLNEIKLDNERPRRLISRLQNLLSCPYPVEPRSLVDSLGRLRDELETHFALEEFYGYFESALLIDSQISARASDLKSQHETIYLDLCELLDMAECVLYGEADIENVWTALVAGFHSFMQTFNQHEQAEEELMMRLCNEDIGVGD